IAGYRFTEFVPAFLRRGEQAVRTRYPALSALSAAALDMNRPFAEQGVERGSVALVYAVNTLHVAQDLEFTLGEIFQALAPGGRLRGAARPAGHPDPARQGATLRGRGGRRHSPRRLKKAQPGATVLR